ncbi:GEVED domain-containing protein [Granulicatella elegans]|uniref:YSIRK family Gram-positive signal peptide n=1 Tax=Granulicatella elegans ATCC 700633 TaxID=626369 RepID=D0BNN7_9LACT|nr:GEVED domain-containing protein [Granulicatella elegans]EEW92380.1 YSIRK family Gram-positive signal peptide [Granulicatella elegans ATCC 700633]
MGKNNKQQPMKRFQRFGIRKFNQGVASVMIASGMFFLAGGMVSADEVTPSKATETTAVAEKKEEVVSAEKPEATTVKKEEAAIVEKQAAAPKKEEATNRQSIVEKSKKEILKASIHTLEEKLKSAQDADSTAVQTAREVLVSAKAVLENDSATLEEVNAQTEAVVALSTVITEAKAQAFDKKLEEKKAEETKAKEETVTTEEKEVEAVKTQLTQVASEAEVTNTLAKTEAIKKDLNEEAKAAIEKAVVANAEALKLAKEILANKNATKAQIDNSLAQLDASIKAVYSQLENAGAKRNDKFEVNLAEEQATALKDASTETGKKWLEDHGYSSLSDIKVKTKEDNLKEIKDLNDQIQWLDFADTNAWTGLTEHNHLQIGSTYKKELIPGYIVTMKVKELKPFESTEIFKNRVAGTDLASSYEPDKENKFNPENGATGLGANPQNGYTHVNNAGLSTGTSKTTIAGTNPAGQPKNGQAAGVKFDVTATYNGKPVKPGIVMTSGEDIGPLESEIYTTNGTPWDLAAIVGYKTNKNAYVPLDKFKDMNGSKTAILKWQDEKFYNALSGEKFATPDASTAGLGSQVFGGYRNNGGAGTPVLSTANVTEVGLYIMSSGQQSSMIGIKFSDFGDLPESYGTAEHFLRTETVDYLTKQKKQIQQPFLGKVKADIDSAPGTRVRGIGSDDATETGDEGVDQLISEEHVHTNVDTGQPEVKFIQGPDNTYKVKLYASANGNDKYTDTVAPAYVRGFIDFNGNGKFDEGEQSNIVQVNGNNQLVELTFTNTQVIDTSKDVVNFRVRIAKDEAQVEKSNGIAYSGEVEDNQIQVAHPPRGDKEETTGKQGETQSVGIEFRTRPTGDDASDLGSNNGKTTFNSYGKIHYTEQSNVISAETTKKVQSEGVMIVNPDGTLTKTYTKAGQGTYTVTDDKVTFTPEASFIGKADGIVLRAVDSNGQSTGWTALTNQNQLENINDGTHSAGTTKTMDAVYIPTVTPKEITADPEKSTDIQGKEQKKTPTFKTEGDAATATPVTPSATYPAKLVDPKTGAKVDSVMVDGEGTYTINPTTGEVTFQPLPTFKGTASGVDVTLTAPVGQDKDGQPVTATATTKYTPTVTAVTPTAKPSDSAGVQGETQKGTPTFTEGNAEVPIKENSVKLLNADGTEANGPVDALDEKGNKVGEYTVNPATGEVTFTPTDKTYTGKVAPAKVQAEDKNGTKVNTTYTPHIVGVIPTATPAESSGIQGQPQDGTVSFAPGETTVEGVKKSVPIKANSAVLLDASGNPVAPGTPVDALDSEGNKVGEYTIDPATNKVTFTPTNKEYKGKVQPANVQAEDENGSKVKTTYTPTIVGVTPNAEPAETTDVQGVEQSKEVTFKSGKATVNGVEKEVPIDTTSYKLLDENGQPAESVPAKNPAGDVIGTYTLKVVDGKATAVFTPTDKTYAGEVAPVTIQAKDTNGTPVTTTYTPNITPVEPTGTPKSTEGAQGQPQEGTPTFTPGNEKVPMKIDATQPAKLIDPATGQPTDATTIPAKDANGKEVGTYTIDPTTGKVTFTPNKDFVGTPVPATVQAKDANGTPTTATYTPTVKPVSPVGVNTFTEDIQGAPQSGKPEFKPGKTTINGEEVEVPMDDKVPATFEDGTTTKTIPGEGTYTVDPDGTVHFTPDKQFKGKGTTMTVVRKDQNGTPVTAEYTAVVHPASPEGTEVETAGVQGKVQSGKPNFIGGKATIDGVEKTVDIDEAVPAKLIDPTTGQEVTSVTIPGEGTYTVAENGTVTFTPDKNFKGKGTELTVKRVDKNGTPALGKYSAVVIGVKPTAEPSVTSDIQGQTQSQSVKFKGGVVEVENPMTKVKTEEVVTIDPTTYTLLDENGQPATEVPAKDPDGNVIGKYTLTTEDGKDPVAVFTPTVKTYSGEVQPVTVQAKDTNGTAVTTTYTPNITPVTPTAKEASSQGAQGQEQSGTPTFTEGNTKTPIDLTVPAKLINPETGEPTDETSVEVPGEGTYTINPETGEVTFKPEPKFTGKAQGVEVQRKDKNGTPATAKYTPTVKAVTPTSDDVVSEDVQGAKQTGTPVFTAGKTTVNGQEVTVEIDETVKPTFDDGTTEKKVPGEGTYTIDENGVVTFTPEPQFTGKASGVTVKRVDKNGTEVTAKYTPTVKPVTPTSDDEVTTDVQGATQKGKPAFEAGKTTVNGVEKTVELDDTKPATFEDGSTEKVVPGEGTYTVAPDGTVTFTPEKSFTGKANGVTVKRVDKNGTPVTAKYTPVVLPVTPSSKDVTSIGEKGQPQSETPVFTAGITKVNGKTVTVEIDDKVAPTFEDGTTEKKVPGEGTYTIDANGKVTFTPEPDFVGKAKGVTVKRVDKNGTPVTATYTPTVLGKTTTENVVSEGAKGQPQSNTPVFKGDVDTTVAPTFEDGTTTKTIPGEGTYTIDANGKVTFTPEPNFVGKATPVKVVRKDKNGKTIKASYTPTVRPDTKFVVVGKDGKETEIIPSKDGKKPSEKISGYKLVKTETDEKGNTKHIYEPVTTKHVDRNGNPIPGTETEEGTKDPKNIPGYNVVETKKLPNGDTEYVYEKVTTRYVDQAGHPIPGTEIEEGTKEPKNIPGYKLVSTTTSGKGDTVHTYAPVQTFFKDKEGNVIPGYPVEEGTTDKKDIPGYRFVETKTLRNGDIEHVYEKVTTPTPTPSVEKPKGIIRDTEGNVIPGFEYDMLSPVLDIPEYEYVETVTDPDGTVRHIYRKVGKTTSTPTTEKVLTTYVDENGELIIPNENGSHPGKELKGYEIVRTEKDTNGNVRNVYRKVTPEAKVMTTFVDENGNVIIPNENGEVPAKDIVEYELVRTEKDANGNVRHIYRKVVAPAPKAVETTPAKQEKVTRQELPNTGTGQESAFLGAAASAILAGLGLVAPKRNKKDEK